MYEAPPNLLVEEVAVSANLDTPESPVDALDETNSRPPRVGSQTRDPDETGTGLKMVSYKKFFLLLLLFVPFSGTN